MDWSGLFGAAGSIVGGYLTSNAIEDATKQQIKALEKQRQFVFDQLNPNKIGSAARAADIQRVQERLRLQGITDPELLKQRYDAQQAISQRLAGLTGDEADKVASAAASEAIAGTPGLKDVKTKLIDQALQELNAGATLPPDVQAEIVGAGLERTGQTTGNAASGIRGNLLKQLVGTAALQLKSERQKRATELAQAAQDMDIKRQAVLGQLFPNLVNKSVAKLGATQSVLGQSNQMVPEAGLGGTDIANLWLARVGATNQLAQSAADVAARGAIGRTAGTNQMIGGGSVAAGNLLNAILNKPKLSDEDYYFLNPV